MRRPPSGRLSSRSSRLRMTSSIIFPSCTRGSAMVPAGVTWEWIVIDDHSSDRTFAVIEEIAKADDRVVGMRLSRNFGSHIAIACGLDNARGACAVVMAADLQDPPETIPQLL